MNATAAGKRLDEFIMKWMDFKFDGKNGSFRALTIEELIAGLEENREIAMQWLREGNEAKVAKDLWTAGKFNLILHYLKSIIHADVFDEIQRELHQDTIEFITYLDGKPNDRKL
jgi:hypothetical protein